MSPCKKPLDNFRGCVKARPPLVVFTLGLLIMGGAFIYVAHYVISHQTVPNLSLKDDWTEFLEHTSSLPWCLNETDDGYTHLLANTTFPYLSAVSVSLPVRVPASSYPSLKNLSYFAGIAARNKLFNDKQLSGVISTLFFLEHAASTSSAESTDVIVPACVTFKGNSEDSLPKFMTAAKDQSSVTCDAPKSINMTSVVTVSLCAEQDKQNTNFFIDDKQTIEMVLSLDDKNNINMHLMYTSYFLFLMAVTVILYGLIKGRSNPSKQKHDKLPV